MILYPLNNKQWNRVSADEFERGEVSDQVCSVSVLSLNTALSKLRIKSFYRLNKYLENGHYQSKT